jgi:hypothetical protein
MVVDQHVARTILSEVSRRALIEKGSPLCIPQRALPAANTKNTICFSMGSWTSYLLPHISGSHMQCQV